MDPSMPAEALVGAVLGGLVGLGADRQAARWPLHPDGTVRRPDWRTVVVVLAGLAAFAGLASRWGDPRDLAVLGIYLLALIVLLATDLDQRLLPDLVTLPLIAYTAVLLVLSILSGDAVNPLVGEKAFGIVSAVAASVLAPAFLLISDRVFRGALGMGDVKLAVSLGLLCGISLLVVGFLIASVAFAAIVLVLLVARRLTLKTAIPFGPALIGAGIVAMLLPG
jgi:leader peptidase (prepilin peptidase)/N-methyltransferase